MDTTLAGCRAPDQTQDGIAIPLIATAAAQEFMSGFSSRSLKRLETPSVGLGPDDRHLRKAERPAVVSNSHEFRLMNVSLLCILTNAKSPVLKHTKPPNKLVGVLVEDRFHDPHFLLSPGRFQP